MPNNVAFIYNGHAVSFDENRFIYLTWECGRRVAIRVSGLTSGRDTPARVSSKTSLGI